MNIGAFLAALGAALMSRLESVGGSLAISFGTLLMGYTADERVIFLNAKQKWVDTYNAGKAAGKDEINAIEDATTATLNEFCADEKAELSKVVTGIVTFLEGAAKRVAGVLTNTATS